MLVAAIISLAAAAVIVLVVLTVVLIALAVRARSAPQRRRRQTETAARLFDDGAISAWSNNDSEEWSDDQREAALIYYNTAGRRARLGGIRADLIPDNHRNHIKRLSKSVDDDDSSRAKWSDLLWLAARVEKRSSTSRSAAPQSDAEPSGGSEMPTGDPTEVNSLATALGLNGSTIDMHEMEEAGNAGAPATPDRPSANSRSRAQNPSDHDSVIDAGNPDASAKDPKGPEADSQDPEAPETTSRGPYISTADGKNPETAREDTSTPAGQNLDIADRDPASETEANSPLPDVPAWILEARAALPKIQPPDPDKAGATTSSDQPDARPILAGTDFPWPRTSIDAQQVTISDDVPEPVDFIPDVDAGELAISDDESTGDSESELAEAGSESSAGESDDKPGPESGQPSNGQGPAEHEATDVDTAGANDVAGSSAPKPAGGLDPSTGHDDDTVAKLDEIRRLKRDAKMARTSSEEATRLTVKYAREGRRKRARAAGNLAFDQAELAKNLRKQARKIERSFKN